MKSSRIFLESFEKCVNLLERRFRIGGSSHDRGETSESGETGETSEMDETSETVETGD